MTFKPLYDLLKSKEKGPKVNKNKKNKQFESGKSIVWNSDLQNIVDKVIDYLRSPECLVFPDYDLPFIVNCDASEKGLGVVLYQKQGRQNRVISFASRTLTDAEKNYNLHSGKLEFLALKWSVMERFDDYLCYGPPFTVFTDNNLLTYILTSTNLNASGLRWVAELSNYQFTIQYKPGKKNGDAEGLSRQLENLRELEEKCTELMNLKSLSIVVC